MAASSIAINMDEPKNPITRLEWQTTGITLNKKLMAMQDGPLARAIDLQAVKKYGVPAKPLQTTAVLNLARRRNVFLLAGTGFGKSRIPEMYFKLMPKKQAPVVLTLNPLDALGNNQVLEKKNAGFTAINLTKLTFNAVEAARIRAGVYNFVYLSPEIFLNSKLWGEVYFSREFQNRLGLIVVDEAHLIYHWGMVAKTRRKGRKKSSALGRHEDRGIFRPSYGNLAGHLLARNSVPLLLMSATCPPKAVRAIQKNLKLNPGNLSILHGGLTRPEIRIVRVVMSESLTSCKDLLRVIPTAVDMPSSKLAPTLIYSGTRRKTGEVLEVLARARGTPNEASVARSSFARRYHACTGEKDKLRVVEDFADRKFPMCSCTMALGLGQNWTRVRSVIHMGRGDPSAVGQMIGRCGRDGRPGLAIIFVEKTRTGGKNKVSQFVSPNDNDPSDDDRMDALAVTPVCLRIAMSMDNLVGYIPLSTDDEGYISEMQREVEKGFPPCRCSNCLPIQAELLMNNITCMSTENFDDFVLKDFDANDPLLKPPPTKPATRVHMKASLPIDGVEPFCKDLLAMAATWINSKLTPRSFIQAKNVFNQSHVDAILAKIDSIGTEEDVRVVVGGKFIDGLVGKVHHAIMEFKAGNIYIEHTKVIQALEEDKYVAKTANKHLNNEQKKRKAELKLVQAAKKAKGSA
ncbi:hypothetical protein MJO29_004358 [Puccinia striiformis f. sp. tritici]|nr:hypothetical protein Pst134EB_008537 [Puccinia striiformis f. sp. tritici]KAI7963931.1 hypothetical protein MJO29_004358 [Puccinia striiformis f. sp. tritici]